MLLWVIVILIFAILGVTSYYKGAIRSLVSLVGLLVAVFVALPLSPTLRPLVPKVGLENPIWGYLLPPVVIFLLVALIFLGLGFLVHRKVSLHYKYATDDFTRLRWERLNQRLGLCVGLVAACVYSFVVGLVIYVVGYPLVQITTDNSPTLQRMVATARKELHSSGLDKSLAALDPMPENFYLATDILGLLDHNMVALRGRLSNYPPFLALGEKDEFKKMATDTDFQTLIQTGGPAWTILNNPDVLAVLNNAQIMEILHKVDLKDLYQYLRTGKSPKYEDEKILGRWRLDVSSTLVRAKEKHPDMSAAQMAQVKLLITVFLTHVTLLAMPDKQVLINMDLSDRAKQIISATEKAVQAAKKAAAGQAGGGGYGAGSYSSRIDANMRARYMSGGNAGGGARGGAGSGGRGGNNRGGGSNGGSGIPANLPGIPHVNLNMKGTWSRDGANYRLRLSPDKGGHQANVAATARDDELVLSLQGQTLTFMRVYR